jgi:hypothetical protein
MFGGDLPRQARDKRTKDSLTTPPPVPQEREIRYLYIYLNVYIKECVRTVEFKEGEEQPREYQIGAGCDQQLAPDLPAVREVALKRGDWLIV